MKGRDLDDLSKLQDQLEDLLACNQFYREAVQAIVIPEDIEDAEPWHSGLFAAGKNLQESEESILKDIVKIRQSMNNN